MVRDAGDLLAHLGDECALLADQLAAALPEGVQASFGAATWVRTEHAADLVRRADRAMHHAKRRHRRDGAAAPS